MKIVNGTALLLMTIALSMSALAREAPNANQLWAKELSFITPIRARSLEPFVPSKRKCRNESTRGERGNCAKVLNYGGSGLGGLPTFGSNLTAEAPHVRVSFVLQRMEIIGDAAAWLDPPDILTAEFNFQTYGSAADQEDVAGWTDVTDVDQAGYLTYPTVIYDALVLNGCAGFNSFPVEHDADYNTGYGVVTPFSGVDNSTIDSTGYYNFSYAIGVDSEPGDGEAHSGIQLSGKVSVVCTSTNSL